MPKFVVLSEFLGDNKWGSKWHIEDAKSPAAAAEQVGAPNDKVLILEVTEPLTVVVNTPHWEPHHEESA